MLKKKNILLFILVALLIYSCSAQQKDTAFYIMLSNLLEHSVPEISVDQLDIITNSYILLDAREKEEFDISHIKGARWIGYNTFSGEAVKEISKKSKIIVYCSIGYRSEKICEKLQKIGYQDISNLYGGIFDWINKGKKVYNLKNKPTNYIHAYNRIWGQWLRKGKKFY